MRCENIEQLYPYVVECTVSAVVRYEHKNNASLEPYEYSCSSSSCPLVNIIVVVLRRLLGQACVTRKIHHAAANTFPPGPLASRGLSPALVGGTLNLSHLYLPVTSCIVNYNYLLIVHHSPHHVRTKKCRIFTIPPSIALWCVSYPYTHKFTPTLKANNLLTDIIHLQVLFFMSHLYISFVGESRRVLRWRITRYGRKHF